MDGVKEYIFPVYDVDSDEFKEYIGFIRTKPELIRCKDCIHNVANRKTDPMDITDYSGQDIVCEYFMTDGQEPDDYCSHAERKEADG